MRALLSAALVASGLGACAGEGAAPKPQVAPSSSPGPGFLAAYAETYRFQAGRPRAVHVLPGGEGVLFLRSGPRDNVGNLMFFDAAAGVERTLLTAEQILEGGAEKLSAEEKARRERMRLAARGIAGFEVSKSGAQILVPLSGKLFVVERATGQVKELPSEGGYPIDPRFSPSGRYVSCVRDGDLYVIDVAGGTQRRLTQRPHELIVNGEAEFVAQEEMDRFRGYWWSPQEDEILFQQTDTTDVERMYIADPAHPERAPQAWPYPRPGQKNVKVRLGLLSLEGTDVPEPRWLDWDRERYPYLVNVKWSEGKPLTVQVQSRLQTKNLVLTLGQEGLRELWKETDAAWINIDQQMPRWLRSANEVLWTTERNGHWQLEVRSGADGSHLRFLNPPELGLREVLAVDEAGGWAYVVASPVPTERHVFRLPLGGGGAEQLTQAAGEHRAVLAEDGKLMVLVSHHADGTSRWQVTEPKTTRAVGELRSVAEAPPWQPSVELTRAGDFHAALVRPRGFNASSKYPVVVYVYGGPGVQMVRAVPDRYLIAQWIADHGFVVVLLDGRGTPGRGRSWERVLKGSFVTVPLEDQAHGLALLAESYPELDLGRVGIFGWSYGGYMSAMAVLKRPEVFHAAVAGAPVTDWLDYDTHYTERYLGLPGGQDDAYLDSSALPLAHQLSRPLLLIHGTADDNVYFSHTLELSDALFRAGRPHQVLPLSNFTHMVADPVVTQRLYQTIVGFLQESLR